MNTKKVKIFAHTLLFFYTIKLGGLIVNKKFSKKDLLEIADSGLSDMTCEQIKALIEKEVEKDSADIDVDYIEFCFDVLAMKQSGESLPSSDITIKSKKLIVRKVLLFVAVFMIFIVTTLTVSANVFHFNIPKEISSWIDGNAKTDINLKLADTTADGYALANSELAKELKTYGVSPITFPEELIKENSKIIKIDNITTKKTISTDVKIEFNYNNSYGDLCISQYADDYKWTGEMVSENVLSGEMIKVNGMDILIFEREDSCSIHYKDNLTVYDIYLETYINNARLFAKSIK